MKRNHAVNSFNLPVRSTPLPNPVAGDIYPDDGTNTNHKGRGYRIYTGSRTVDFGYRSPLAEKVINSVEDLPTPTDESDGLGLAYRLEAGYYIIGANISIAYPIAPSANGVSVVIDGMVLNTITYTGTGALFRANTSIGFYELVIRNIVLTDSTGIASLFAVEGNVSESVYLQFSIVNNFGSLGYVWSIVWLELAANFMQGFSTGLNTEWCAQISLSQNQLFAPSASLSGACITFDGGSSNIVSVTDSIFTLLNSSHSAVDIKSSFAGFVTLANSFVDTSLAGVPFAAGSKNQTELRINSNNVRGIPNSNIIGSFYMERNENDTAIANVGETGAFTSVADAGGGKVTITSASHGLSNDDIVWIIDDEYTGKYVISGVTTDTFDIVATWGETTTGTWETHWVKIEGTTLSLINERASMTDNNEITFSNLEAQVATIEFTANSENDGVAAAKDWEFAIMKNGARLKGPLVTRQMTNVTVNSMGISAASIIAGDVFEAYVRNVLDTTDCIIVNMTLIVRGV